MWSDYPRRPGGATGVLVQQHDGDGYAGMAYGAAPPGAALASCELHFSVRYRLAEYASFMWQHGHFLIRRREIGFPAGWYLLVKSTALAVLNFVLQGRSRRTYAFTIDEHGIVRTADTGVTLIGWEDVLGMRPYARGFLLVLKRGTLPVPFRCLAPSQQAALRSLVEAKALVLE